MSHGVSARFFCVFFLMLLLCVVQILAGFLGQIERLCGIVSSGVQFLFWLIFLVFSIVPFYTKIILKVSSFLKHVTGYDKNPSRCLGKIYGTDTRKTVASKLCMS